ncbi:MAG: pyridoxal kinase [Rhodospirillaceae bacterium]|nr:pyridoxal kinase [Rhodospirillaceae bacterium]MBT5667673.1 pyridoxal kinase [Rhodospirillaceae bacterium]MBT5812643.1 pyridoxal kinase [Rhodospirillaceae bacterium]
MAILSLQSSVVRGHVGNAAARPILHRLGFEVWAIDTVTFSNHPGHGAFTGRAHDPEIIADLIDGLTADLDRCDAVLSGYLGRAGTGPVVLDAVAAVKRARPDALYCCDPVIGDNGASYVSEGLPEFFRDHGVPAADIVTPNVFEAEWLTGIAIDSMERAHAAARALRSRGPGLVVVTGVRHDMESVTLALDGDVAWIVATPVLDMASHGAGDAFTALFLGFYLSSRDAPDALSRAASGLHAILRRTLELGGGGDLRLIPALDDAVAPTQQFKARRFS